MSFISARSLIDGYLSPDSGDQAAVGIVFGSEQGQVRAFSFGTSAFACRACTGERLHKPVTAPQFGSVSTRSSIAVSIAAASVGTSNFSQWKK
jgi:hypothetical protein